ncbi:MAG: DUF3592 domain-containing protein [Polyangiales bacterium]
MPKLNGAIAAVHELVHYPALRYSRCVNPPERSRQSLRPIAWLRGMLFTIVGSALLIIALSLGASRREFLQHAVSSDGTVVKLNAGSAHPEIRFATASGETVSYPQGGVIGGYQPGQRVRVLYLADDVHRTACIDDPGALWFATGCTALLGLSHVTLGLYSLLSRRPRASKGNN